MIPAEQQVRSRPAALDIMHATRAMDPFAGSSVRALTDAEVRWAGLMRDWMTARGIEL